MASCVDKYCPNAQRCVDPFHVFPERQTRWIRSVGRVYSHAHRRAKSLPKRKPGCHAKGETVPGKKKVNRVKNLRYALLNNPEYLSENQQAQLQF